MGEVPRVARRRRSIESIETMRVWVLNDVGEVVFPFQREDLLRC